MCAPAPLLLITFPKSLGCSERRKCFHTFLYFGVFSSLPIVINSHCLYLNTHMNGNQSGGGGPDNESSTTHMRLVSKVRGILLFIEAFFRKRLLVYIHDAIKQRSVRALTSLIRQLIFTLCRQLRLSEREAGNTENWRSMAAICLMKMGLWGSGEGKQ